MSNYVLPYGDLVRIAVLATSRGAIGRVAWGEAAKKAFVTLLDENVTRVCERYPDIKPENAVQSFNNLTADQYVKGAWDQIDTILAERNTPLTAIYAARAVKSISDFVNNSTDTGWREAHLLAMTAGFVAATVLVK